MNKDKIDRYKLTGSFHTLAIKTNEPINNGSNDVYQASTHVDQCHTTLKINLNKVKGDIYSFNDFKNIFFMVADSIGMEHYRILRADFRLDSYDPDHYQAFKKLNKYLISLMAVTYKVKNCYKTDNLFSHKQLSIAIKNDYFQLENYDRNAKSKLTENHMEKAQSRLEERSMASSFTGTQDQMEQLQQEFIDKWFDRWDKAIKNHDLLLAKYNDELVAIYEANKDAFPVRFRSITEFIMQYQDDIFSQKQLINLLERLGVDNAKERAKSYKRRYGIEYISKKDVKTAIEEVKRATKKYFLG